MARPRVAVIGAGPLGLMALKVLREDGFDATAFESRSWVGGIWNYSDDEKISVAKTTRFNSSRYRSAISDYPFPEDTDDFPSWQQMHTYLEGYVDHFGLRRHIHLNSPVSGLERKDGRWLVQMSPKDGSTRQETFDKVVVATGSFVKPKWPKFVGIEKFAGQQVHTMHFHSPEQFKDKNVLLIGLHASSQDVASALEGHAKQVYASHRNGVILMRRFTPDGAAFDTDLTLNFMFFQMFMQTWFPNVFTWLLDKMIDGMSKKAFPRVKKSWNFEKGPSIATTAPLLADQLWPLLESGFVEPVEPVVEVNGSKTVRLRDGMVLDDIDAIVYCTGYHIVAPVVPAEWNPYPKDGDSPYLYRNTFSLHPDPAVRESLVFLGHGGVPFPGFVTFELQAMAISQIWQGNHKLPSYERQQQWYHDNQVWRQELLKAQKSEATFYTVFLPFPQHIQFLDDASGAEVLEHFGWFSTKAWSFWWRDRELYSMIKSGLFTPAIWRLFDSDKRKAWPRARAQIVRDNELWKEAIGRKSAEMKASEKA